MWFPLIQLLNLWEHGCDSWNSGTLMLPGLPVWASIMVQLRKTVVGDFGTSKIIATLCSDFEILLPFEVVV